MPWFGLRRAELVSVLVDLVQVAGTDVLWTTVRGSRQELPSHLGRPNVRKAATLSCLALREPQGASTLGGEGCAPRWRGPCEGCRESDRVVET